MHYDYQYIPVLIPLLVNSWLTPVLDLNTLTEQVPPKTKLKGKGCVVYHRTSKWSTYVHDDLHGDFAVFIFPPFLHVNSLGIVCLVLLGNCIKRDRHPFFFLFF